MDAAIFLGRMRSLMTTTRTLRSSRSSIRAFSSDRSIHHANSMMDSPKATDEEAAGVGSTLSRPLTSCPLGNCKPLVTPAKLTWVGLHRPKRVSPSALCPLHRSHDVDDRIQIEEEEVAVELLFDRLDHEQVGAATSKQQVGHQVQITAVERIITAFTQDSIVTEATI